MLRFKNQWRQVLAAPVGAGDLEITLSDASALDFGDGDYYLLTLLQSGGAGFEVVKATAKVGNVLTVVRAQEGTAALVFGAGDAVEIRASAGGLEELSRCAAGVGFDVTLNASGAGVVGAGGVTVANDAKLLSVAALRNFLPVGVILSMAGAGWVDNQTMEGWYACLGGTVPSDGRPGAGTAIPDLRDRFLYGAANTAVGASAGNIGYTGGSNDFMDHTHGFNNPNMPGHSHGHTLSIAAHADHNHNAASYFAYPDGPYTWGLRTPESATHQTGGSGASYAHNFSGGIGSGPSGDNALATTGGSVNAVSGPRTNANRPAFYTVLYIWRAA